MFVPARHPPGTLAAPVSVAPKHVLKLLARTPEHIAGGRLTSGKSSVCKQTNLHPISSTFVNCWWNIATILQKMTKFGSESCEKMLKVAFSKKVLSASTSRSWTSLSALVPGAISMAQTQKSDEINVKNVTGRLFLSRFERLKRKFRSNLLVQGTKNLVLGRVGYGCQGESNTFLSRIQNWLKVNEFGRISGNCNEICRQRF